MGCTGAVNSEEEKAVGGRGGTPWEGAVVPTPVDGALFGHHVEEVCVCVCVCLQTWMFVRPRILIMCSYMCVSNCVCVCVCVCAHVMQVAVGMHHVAVVASKLSSNGRRPEDTCRTRLIMWGRGQAGQLGSEGTRDYNMPQVCVYTCMCTRVHGIPPAISALSMQ